MGHLHATTEGMTELSASNVTNPSLAQTSRENGLVFYYRTDNFFMAVEIVSNFMSINVGFGNKQQLLTLDSDNSYISDNTWHEVHIGRYESFVTLEVDNVQKQAQLANPTPVLYNKDIYIGGKIS